MIKNSAIQSAVLFFTFVLFSVNLFGQHKRDFEIEISLKQRLIKTSAKESVTVKITNLGTADFETKTLKYASFYLLKWGESDFYISGRDFAKNIKKNKVIKQNESAQFEFKLNNLKWRARLENSKKEGKKFKTITPAVYYFYAVIELGGSKSGADNRSEEFYGSNTITVKLISK